MNSQQRNSDKWYGEKLRLARIKAGLTQVQLSMRAGLPQERISRMERGKNSINLTDYVRAMRALNTEYVKGMSPGDGGELDIFCQLSNFAILKFQDSQNDIRFTDLRGPLVAYREGSNGEVIYLPANQPAWYELRENLSTIQKESQLDPEAVGHRPANINQLSLPLRIWKQVAVGTPS